MKLTVAALLSASLLLLLLKQLAANGWLIARPAYSALFVYGLGLACLLACSALAWQRNIVVGVEEHEHGFFGGPDPSDYSPIYQGESAWIGLLVLLPAVLVGLSRLQRNKPYVEFRQSLTLFFPFWFILAICCQLQFFNSSDKPLFNNKELTSPRRL